MCKPPDAKGFSQPAPEAGVLEERPWAALSLALWLALRLIEADPNETAAIEREIDRLYQETDDAADMRLLAEVLAGIRGKGGAHAS